MDSKNSKKSDIVKRTNFSKEESSQVIQMVNRKIPKTNLNDDQDENFDGFNEENENSDIELDYPNAETTGSFNSSDEYMSNMSEDECATFNCNECGKKFKNTISLKAHLAKKHNPRALVNCEFCYTKYRGDFSDHLKSEHSLMDGGYICKKCEFIGADYKSIINHRHEKEILLVCKYCNKMYKSKENYKQHLENHQINESSKKKKRTYNCKTCGKRIVILGLLKNSKSDKQPDYSLKCKLCRDLFQNYSGRIYKCTYCNHAFFKRGQLKKHLVEHQVSANNKAVTVDSD